MPELEKAIAAQTRLLQAEKGLTEEQKNHYIGCLMDEVVGCPSFYDACTFATARQRAIALLRVVKPELFARTT